MLETSARPPIGALGLHPGFRDKEGALLAALLQSTDYGVLVSGLDRQDLVANRRLGELFTMPPQLIVENDPDAVRGWARSRVKTPDVFDSVLERAYDDPYLIHEDELELIGPMPVFLRRYTGPVYDPNGTPIARLWTFLDITPTHQIHARVQAELAAATDALQKTQRRMVELEKLHLAGTLATSVAHDIRNILTVLQMEVEALPPGVADPVRDQLYRFAALTHRLLAFSRPSVLESRPTSLNAVIRRVIPLIAAQAQINDVEIVTDLPGELPEVAADSNQLDHLFVNLCLNGIQAMSLGGGTLTLKVEADGTWVYASVVDTGCGIPAEIVPRLFDPFFTTRATGTGLGLFSCKRIVEDHGGQLTVESELGAGACFVVALPIRRGRTGEDRQEER
jgi:signal transduction histidine kinase